MSGTGRPLRQWGQIGHGRGTGTGCQQLGRAIGTSVYFMSEQFFYVKLLMLQKISN